MVNVTSKGATGFILGGIFASCIWGIITVPVKTPFIIGTVIMAIILLFIGIYHLADHWN